MEKHMVTIQPLCPELCEDWLGFFEKIAFVDHGEWAFCYCLEGHLDPETNDKSTELKDRRKKAVELIETGEMPGYLAYLDNMVVGWCNTNDRKKYKYITEMFQRIGYQTNDKADAKVKSVYCFLIAPEYRGKGIAQSLLKRVCEDAAQDGYSCIEAYPFSDKKFEYQYHGTSGMYERNGFFEIADLNYVKVVRKNLFCL